ncbi:hypothetical protein [Tenacibaculum finnmarkense]|uniref:hypothetical protein n=1 Tax=Tenacibaculum finnmarkense TaxID=2781243 RepID=UPI00073922CC|nr:hypothetical protein [Tenacibaculum finnmarkense]ALU74273.1 hypothetical protein AUW17_02865 [Tenacibaculum dicentrarchi]MCD8428880.1 hypothetical protein [Tenacibaculum finnmarkense genomovar ulcerans]MCG8235768.1 hypothetical protein [Tenacibaculum finnmarkense genomovar ulcerans]MCG8829898.1 hypothetical protein [Tenacibaculum finnmarkense]
MVSFIQENIGEILSYTLGAGGVGMAILERRKNNAITKGVEADVESKEIDNGSKVIDMYKSALDDLPIRYEKKYQETSQLWERKFQMMTEEMSQLESSYKRKNNLLEDEIKLKNKFILSLKRELREKDTENKLLKKQLKDANNSTQ